MTRFTLAKVRRMCELGAVIVLVAVSASLKLDLVYRCLTCGNVTSGALDRRMFSEQRVAGGVVVRDRELDLLESFYRVAGLAFSAVRPLGELPTMRVLVTVTARAKWDNFREIAALVARLTFHIGMLSQQRVRRLRVVELRCGGGGLPSRSRVAALAALLEESAVRIGMAG